jgi:hypothetical protein
MRNLKGKARKCTFQTKFRNGLEPPHQRAHTDLKILQWNAGGMSQNKKTELHLNLVKHNVDIFAIMETNLTAEKLIYCQLSGYTLYSLPKYRQIASGMLVGVRNSLSAEFKIVKKWATQKTRAK